MMSIDVRRVIPHEEPLRWQIGASKSLLLRGESKCMDHLVNVLFSMKTLYNPQLPKTLN